MSKQVNRETILCFLHCLPLTPKYSNRLTQRGNNHEHKKLKTLSLPSKTNEFAPNGKAVIKIKFLVTQKITLLTLVLAARGSQAR